MERLNEAKPGERSGADVERSDGAGGGEPSGPFALRVAEGRHGVYGPRRGDDPAQRSFTARVRPARGQTLLPMFGAASKPPPAEPISTHDSPPSPPVAPPGPGGATLQPPPGRSLTGLALRNGGEPGRPAAGLAKAVSAAPGEVPVAKNAPGLAAVDRSPGDRPRQAGPETPGGDPIMEATSTTAPPPAIASGEKAKARDILAAIKTLQQIEREHRPATTDERDILSRFGGFGAVATRLFPDPGHRPLQGRGLEGAGRGAAIAADARGIQLGQTHHLQRLLHLAGGRGRHAPGAGPAGRLRAGHRAGAGLRHRQLSWPRPRPGSAISASSWTACRAGSPAPCIPATTSASRASATRCCPRGGSTR